MSLCFEATPLGWGHYAGSGDAVVQKVTDLVQGHEEHVNEALEDWRGTISKFTAMMEDHAGIVHSLEASSSQFESRCPAWSSAVFVSWSCIFQYKLGRQHLSGIR